MANTNMFLYWGSGSGPCVRVITVLAEKGLWEGCPNKLIEFSQKEHKGEEIMQINPRGQVPTFKDGDIVVNESTAVCLYLEDRYSAQTNRLIPVEPAGRAQVYQRLFEVKNLDTLIAEPIIRYKLRTPKEAWDQALLKERLTVADAELQRWDGYVREKCYLVGECFSMADIFLYTELAFFQRFGLSLEKYPGVKQYFEFLKQRPSLQVSSPPHWKVTPGFDFLSDLIQE